MMDQGKLLFVVEIPPNFESDVRAVLVANPQWWGKRGNVDEAPGYGPLRLLEGAQRAARLLPEFGVQDEDLSIYHDRVSRDAMKILASPELTRTVADELLSVLAARAMAIRHSIKPAQGPTPRT